MPLVPPPGAAPAGQGQRERALASFERGKVPNLIATDVAARGIDVAAITHVVNYDLPLMAERDHTGHKGDLRPDIETYIHRIGAWPFLHMRKLDVRVCDWR